MRTVHFTIIILFAAATVVFAFQNLEIVTMAFLGFKARAPLALLTSVIYVLGALTGSSVFALLRRSYKGYREPLDEAEER
jgi:uncharacterized integral membrane protein